MVAPLQWAAYALLMVAQLLWCLRKLHARFADEFKSATARGALGREAQAMGYVTV